MNPQQKQDLRHVVLEAIALRHPTSLAVNAIWRRVKSQVDFEITEADVEAALEFLRGLALARFETDGLGSTKYWQSTSAGVLANERGKIPEQPHSRE